MRRLIWVFCLTISCYLFAASVPAYADIDTNLHKGTVVATDQSIGDHSVISRSGPKMNRSNTQRKRSQASRNGSAETPGSRRQSARMKNDANRRAIKQYVSELSIQQKCIAIGAAKCASPAAPLMSDFVAEGTTVPGVAEPAVETEVILTPQEVAYTAFARLDLEAAKPMVGPPPSSNRWKMAAVGYPLWLWGDGDPNPAPVSDSVGGLFVSLDAHVSKIVFNMGDGSRVTCAGIGRKWTKAVPAGQKSPACGHVYTSPSLPKGSYTVTATTYWSVAWNVTGVTGVIPFAQSASTTIPVGELQVLVR